MDFPLQHKPGQNFIFLRKAACIPNGCNHPSGNIFSSYIVLEISYHPIIDDRSTPNQVFAHCQWQYAEISPYS